MDMTTNFHGVKSMSAEMRGTTSWLRIEGKSGNYIAVFMPFQQAKMIADAFAEYDAEPYPLTYDEALGMKCDREASLDRDMIAAGRR